ncbi:MAG: hypothetical protein JNJ44_03075 [Zoogloeaceae bacterium]|nr:hypothetical protein [Zoogloeaceae bacterium]
MKPCHPLEDWEGPFRTAVGACFGGERVVFRGKDLHRELGEASWMELYVFGITGRRYGERELKVFNALWTYTSYPDSRIWNNRVAALAGTTRSTGNLAMSAALAISEAAIFGRQIDLRAIEFLQRTQKMLDQGEDLAEIVAQELRCRRSLAGYGRPFTADDERLAPLRAHLAQIGFPLGPGQRLAVEIDDVLQRNRWRLKMNYGGLAAALATDLGLSPAEFYSFAFPAFLAGMQPCYAEALEKPAGGIMPTRCAGLAYNGPPPRRWP